MSFYDKDMEYDTKWLDPPKPYEEEYDEDDDFEEEDTGISFRDAFFLYLKFFIPVYNIYLLLKIVIGGGGIDKDLSNLFRAQTLFFLLTSALLVGGTYFLTLHMLNPKPAVSETEQLLDTEAIAEVIESSSETQEPRYAEEEWAVTEAEVVPAEIKGSETEEAAEDKPVTTISGIYDVNDKNLISSCSIYGIPAAGIKNGHAMVTAAYDTNQNLLDPENDYCISNVTDIVGTDGVEIGEEVYAVFGKDNMSGVILVAAAKDLIDSDDLLVFTYADVTGEYTENDVTALYKSFEAGDIKAIPLTDYEEMLSVGLPENEKDLF